MKLVVAAVALLVSSFLLSAQAPESSQSNTGVIEGRVVSSTTSDPIPDVLVTLLLPAPAGLSPEELQQRSAQLEYARLMALVTPGGGTQAAEETRIDGNPSNDIYILSDSAGHFVFRNLAPGRYTVRAARQGYTGPPRNGGYSSGTEKSVEVRVGSASAELVMFPSVIIAGKVFDPLGEPVANAIVREFRLLYRDGQEHWAAAPDRMTNDLGEFRFNTGPGAGFISVTASAGGSPKSWDQTFYPSVTEPENATLVPMPPGSQTTMLDIHLQPRRPSFSVRGVAINPFAVANPRTGVVDRSVTNFFLIPPTPSVFNISTVLNAIPVASRPNGEFEIQNVRPGQYELVGYVTDTATRARLIARTPVDVRGTDIEGVSLTIDPGVTLTGQLEFRGTAKAGSSSALTVALQAISGFPLNSSQKIENGMFVMEHVPRIPYRVSVSGLPPGAYVADVRLAGNSVFDDGFVPDEGSGPLQIVVGAAGETVTGMVKGPKGELFEAGNVVLVPPVEQRQNPARFQTGIIDGQGHFTIRNVPPGSYTVYAWASVQSSAWMNTKFMSQYQARGRTVRVVAGSRNELELEGIPDVP